MLMQLMAAELVTGPTVTPTSLMAQAAKADGAPLPTSNAATELDASKSRTLPRPARITSPLPEVSKTSAREQEG